MFQLSATVPGDNECYDVCDEPRRGLDKIRLDLREAKSIHDLPLELAWMLLLR